jgi:hypothetical protein
MLLAEGHVIPGKMASYDASGHPRRASRGRIEAVLERVGGVGDVIPRERAGAALKCG